MPLPVWPSGVRYQPRRNDWSMPQPFAPPIASSMNQNNVRLRSTPGSNVALVQQIIRMTAAAYATLDAFIRVTLNNGTSRFTMPVWLGSSYVTTTVQFEPGSPSVAQQDRFVAVSMKLRVYDI